MDLEQLIERWEGQDVFISEDEETGATFIIAIHSVRGNRAVGGTRIKDYPGLTEAVRDAQRLAGGMSLKWAAAGIEAGGAKGVIHFSGQLEEAAREQLLLRYGERVGERQGVFVTGPDMGTSPEDMDLIAQTAPGCVFGCTQQAGGAGDPAPFTAAGVYTSMQVVAKRLFGAGGLAGLRVMVQGVGNVAGHLVQLLQEEGARVMFSDIDPEVSRRFANHGLPFIPPDQVYDTDCEIFAPCAIGGILNADSIEKLRCAAVVGAANNQLREPADAERLRSRGILYAPDFVANCGGAIALINIETQGMNRMAAMQAIESAVHQNLGAILDEAEAEGCSTEDAARRLAQERIRG
jgi:leucine dehydrogenase